MKAETLDGWLPRGTLAVSLVVNVEEGSELSVARGDDSMEPVDELGMYAKGPLRNLPNESNYRYGIIEGGPRVARLLAAHGVRATWTCAAQALEAAPTLADVIRAGHHEVCAHGWRWIPQHRMTIEQEREFIQRATESLQRSTGARPRGWLSRYYYTEHTRALLAEFGYQYHMDDFSADAPFWDDTPAGPLLVIPYQLDTNDMKLWAHPAYTPDRWLRYACDTVDWLAREAAQRSVLASVGVHLRIIGRPGRIGALEAFLQHVTRTPGATFMTRAEIADACRSLARVEPLEHSSETRRTG
jgi:peptidoglycan/xylan/chitin deacetylase (PgdA/CDA1 family)